MIIFIFSSALLPILELLPPVHVGSGKSLYKEMNVIFYLRVGPPALEEFSNVVSVSFPVCLDEIDSGLLIDLSVVLSF
jgi:hypothetical protein